MSTQDLREPIAFIGIGCHLPDGSTALITRNGVHAASALLDPQQPVRRASDGLTPSGPSRRIWHV